MIRFCTSSVVSSMPAVGVLFVANIDWERPTLDLAMRPCLLLPEDD